MKVASTQAQDLSTQDSHAVAHQPCAGHVAAVSSVPRNSQSAKPNVVLIMTDDMGYADIGSYGASDIRTPNIDSLARDGVRLTDFYSNGVLCSPTRAGFISGRYQQRYGVENALPNAGAPGSERGLEAAGFSLPRLLRNNGYATALVGKWHLGYTPDMSPGAHGFEYFFGLKSGFHDYYQHTSGDGKPDLWENERPIQRQGYMTDLITERAVKFIGSTRDVRSSSTSRSTRRIGRTRCPTSRRSRPATAAT